MYVGGLKVYINPIQIHPTKVLYVLSTKALLRIDVWVLGYLLDEFINYKLSIIIL